MNKEFAIQMADQFSKRDGIKYYVIHQPETYNEIFRNVGYKVTPLLNKDNTASVVYETK